MLRLNADKPHRWKADVERSIDLYNDWFLRFAPETFRLQRTQTTGQVADALETTDLLRDLSPRALQANPGALRMLRMVCAPPLARDRLVGLAYVRKNLVASMEGKPGSAPRMPPRMSETEQMEQLQRICDTIAELADRDLFTWLETGENPTEEQVTRATMVVADRLCGAATDPIIRNAQEHRQLDTLSSWLTAKGYREVPPSSVGGVRELPPGSFALRMNVWVGKGKIPVNVSVDCVVQPLLATNGSVPVFIEAKSAGDTTNTNKRRKEEAQKCRQLASHFGQSVQYVLFLCGYFEPGYLGYEAAEGIDWVWEHRVSDLEPLLASDLPGSGRLQESDATYRAAAQTQEAQRLSRQKEIDRKKQQSERNRRGQFSTPFHLASDITLYSYSLHRAECEVHFLEPAVGTGVFFSALQSCGIDDLAALATGIDIDTEYAAVAADLWPAEPFEVRTMDFVDFSGGSDRSGVYDLLCTNPPYVRHHHLPSALKTRLRERIVAELGLNPSGLSGFYIYFVLLSHALLTEGAVASWLIPSEFLSVNYGRVLREYLLKHVKLVRIHRFDPGDLQFDDALVSSCVVTYIKEKPPQHHEFLFTYGGTLASPSNTRTICSDAVSYTEKWSSLGDLDNRTNRGNGICIGDLFTIKRGVATGANAFFIVDETTIREYEIPSRFLKPILPSPRHIRELVIATDAEGWPQLSEARYLLDCPLPADVVCRDFPGLWRYLAKGEAEGISERYLCSARKVWYVQEQREAALYMATYMGRSRSESGSPFRFFLNLSKAIGTNVFLLLYPKPSVVACIEGRQERMLELLDRLNSLTREHTVNGGRTYGGGLHKLEPKELANLTMDSIPTWIEVQKPLELPLWQGS